MIRHIRLVCETVFSHFTDLSTERFFDEMSKEFFVWHQTKYKIQMNYE